MTASDVHKKILEISFKYISGAPPIAVESLASELDLSGEELDRHLGHLKTLGLINREDNFVIITESGKKASLP